jgi:hypothetical protein
MGGNFDLTVRMNDVSTGGQGDQVSILLQNPATSQLVFSSNWNGTQTALQTLGGGNVQVRNTATARTSAEAAVQSAETTTSFTVNAYPNPFADKVTLSIGSEVTGDVALTVVDGKGRTVTRQVAGAAEQVPPAPWKSTSPVNRTACTCSTYSPAPSAK